MLVDECMSMTRRKGFMGNTFFFKTLHANPVLRPVLVAPTMAACNATSFGSPYCGRLDEVSQKDHCTGHSSAFIAFDYKIEQCIFA